MSAARRLRAGLALLSIGGICSAAALAESGATRDRPGRGHREVPMLLAQAPLSDGWPRPERARQSVTHLNLLRGVPFFAGLDDERLRWVIAHSREWKVEADEEISTSLKGPDNFWVLLDGGWQIETGDRSLAAGNNEAVNWYGGPELHALGASSRLVATVPGYVLNLRWETVQELRRAAPAIDRRLNEGLARYRELLR